MRDRVDLAFLQNRVVSSVSQAGEASIVITFDEAYPYYKDYNIYTLLVGDMLQAGTTRTEPYNHYSLLRSVEFNFSTGTLGRNDEAAAPCWSLTGG